MNSGRTPEEYLQFFAEIFAQLDAEPKPRTLLIGAPNLTIDLVGGEIVFSVAGRTVKGNFRRRWLAEHPVPFTFPRHGRVKFRFLPTSNNRVKVRA